MSATIETVSGLCAACGVPFDSQYFDDSSVQPAPALGAEIVLARFDLPPQYCGVLKYFAQFTDAFAISSANVATPGIEWKLLVNNHALFPYINLRHIVNPWGFGSYEINIRLDEGSTIEMAARVVGDVQSIQTIGGRIVGRFWYNPAYGG